MARAVRTSRTWHGDELKARGHRATGRAAVGMGERVAREQKGAAHVLSGDNRRAIHAAAPAGAPHPAQLEGTGAHPLAATAASARRGPSSWQVEVGSWQPYACVENNRGGDHRFADIGWELATPFFDGIVHRAWAEERM